MDGISQFSSDSGFSGDHDLTEDHFVDHLANDLSFFLRGCRSPPQLDVGKSSDALLDEFPKTAALHPLIQEYQGTPHS